MTNWSKAGFVLILGLVVSGIQTGASQAGVITQDVAFKQVTLLDGVGLVTLSSGTSGFPPLANDTILVFDKDLGDLVSVEINMTGTMSVSAYALIPLVNFPSSSSGTLILSSHSAGFWFDGSPYFSSNTLPGRTAGCSGILSCIATLPAPELNISASGTFHGDDAKRFRNSTFMDIRNSGRLTTSYPAGITGRLVVEGTLEIIYNYTSIAPGNGGAGTTSEGGHKIPEPGTLGILMAGFTGLCVTRRRRRTRALREKLSGQA